MKKILCFTLAICASNLTYAEKFPGLIVAKFYNEAMSIPKGWELAYVGEESGIQVFNMKRNFDKFPQTSFLNVKDQMVRLMCGDPDLKKMMEQGLKVRADAVDLKDKKTKKTKGEVLNSCPY